MNFIIALRAMSFKIQAFYHWSPASLPLPSCLVHHRIFILTVMTIVIVGRKNGSSIENPIKLPAPI